MPTSLDRIGGGKNVKDNEYPFYTDDSTKPNFDVSQIISQIGMAFNSDTVSGIEAVTASKASANKLVATGPGGFMPLTTIPQSTLSIGGGPPIVHPSASVILVSNSLGSYAALSVDTDGSLRITPTSSAVGAQIMYLKSGTSTYWITFDATDKVLIANLSSFTTTATSISLVDTNLFIWSVTISSDGVFVTTKIGSL